jgi:hypothetical protein
MQLGSGTPGDFRVLNNLVPLAMAVDQVQGLLYWSEVDADEVVGRVVAHDLDSGQEVTRVTEPAISVAVDPYDSFLYYSSLEGHKIRRLPLAGGSVTDFLTLADALPVGLTLDLSILGDLDFDRMLGLSDYVIFRENYPTGTRRSQGDLDGSHSVDLIDFGIFREELISGGAVAVPEPGTLCLSLIALGMLALPMVRQGFRKLGLSF